MRTLLFLLLFTTPCFASDLSETTLLARWAHLETRNNGANDSYGTLVRLERPLWREFCGAIEIDYHARQHFPATEDVKGSWGSLYGYGAMANLIFRPEVTEKISPYLLAGAGYYWWNFKENPHLQDHMVTVSVYPSIAYKVAAGVDYKLSERWSVNLEVSYFDTKIKKEAIDNTGTEWHILGDDVIGNEQIQIGVGMRYRF